MPETDFKYDVFISYSHKDEEWVVNTLLPSLEDTGLKVCVDFRDFVPGKPSRHNMRDACKESAYTVLVMTPAWMASEWTKFEGLLTLLHDPSGNRQRTIPILLEKCDIPEDIQIFTYVDFTRRDREVMEWQRLLKACGRDGKFRLRTKKSRTLKADKKTAQLILDGEYESFDEKTLVAALAGMLNVNKNHIRILYTGKGSIVIDLELPTKAAHLLIKMALEKDFQLRKLGIRSVQLEGQKTISVTDVKDWFLAHPYPMPPNFTGRPERNMLTEWLNSDKDHPLLIIRALGGFGKSALTWHWLTHDVDAKGYPKVVFWSFYEGDSSFDHFLIETLKYLGVLNAEQLNQYQQVDVLLNLLRNPGILLILDGFERVLHAYGSMGAAYQGDDIQKDDSQDTSRDCINMLADAFLRSIGAYGGMLKGKVLMTTRLTPRAVEKHGQFLQGVREEELSAMYTDDAVEFFHAQGIRGTHSEIEVACESYGYHPLSLRILSGWILNDRNTPGDIAAAKNLEITNDIIQNKHHILEVGFNSLSSPQKKLLGRIACFRSAMDYEALKTLHGDDKGSLSFDTSLKILESRGLLQWDRKTNKYDLHPIVRRYAYDNLTAADRRGAHERLVNYFEAIPEPAKVDKLEDLAPVIELYHHMVRAGNLDEAVNLFRDRLHDTLYFQFGSYQLMIELTRALFLDSEDQPPHLKDERAQAWILNSLANAYALSGHSRQAIPLFEKFISITEKRDDKSNLAAGLGNVAFDYIRIGALKEAEHSLRRRIDLCSEIKDEFQKAIGHHELGRTLSYRGVWQEAKKELDISLEISEKLKQIQMQGISWEYYALRFLLIARDKVNNARPFANNVKSAVESAERAIEFADEDKKRGQPHPRDYVRAYLLLGAAYRMNNEMNKTEENLSKALNLCRQINLVEMEADILLELAKLDYDRGDFNLAREKAEEALTITQRSGYVLQGADVNLFLAQYVLEQEKDKVRAKEYAETALKLATCDGPPYYYKVAYEEAERMLEKLKDE